MHVRIRSITLGLATLVACVPETPTSPTEFVTSASGPIRARPCLGDSLFIDVPVHGSPSWSDLGFIPALEQALTIEANASSPPHWFCGADQVVCPSGAVVAAVTSVLPVRSSPSWRADGHLRFLRVKFYDARLGTQLELRPGGQCAAVQTVRTRLAIATGAPASSVYIGRECDGSAQTVEAHATTEMLTWHLPRAGASASAAVLAPRPRALQNVDLATVDTGVVGPVAASADLDLATQVDLVGGAHMHAHGTAMAILQRQLAPAATLHSYRALGSGGSGVSADLGLALDQALFATATNTRPLVVDLSLGWPSELARAAELSDPTCSTHEDPFGEIVRYELELARRLDDTNTRRVFVVTAAGNQPLRTPIDVFPNPPAGLAAATCSPSSLVTFPWFFPASWQFVDTCRVPNETTKVAFGVTAVDDRDRPAGNAVAGAEAPLVAPGQHVYVSHPAAAAAFGAPICVNGGESPAQVRMPMALTGSSVPAAMISAAAARAQSLRIDNALTPLTWDGLARALYVSGRGLCRDSGRLEVRQLDVARLEHTVTSCEPLIGCLEGLTGAATIPDGIMTSCAAQIGACGLEPVDRTGNIVRTCAPPPTTSVPWPASYADTLVACGPSDGRDLFDISTCGAMCPFELLPYRTLLGKIGPQPNSGSCPDCRLRVTPELAIAQPIAEINPLLPSGSYVVDPYLLITGFDSAGTPFTKFAAINQMGQVWKPGQVYKPSVPLGELDIDWDTASSKLVGTLHTPGSSPGQDAAPLTLEVVE